ncbi:hypothetical protein GALMADRAFT_937472 [Galerina marginata CBS 339.88]|uniref:Uncharacterized protein n=1 Tax=Galerina marginata (strain CBS 339.88) TaxID=685588 RepID=A0A067S1W3_GALM3|nr:hypothetical protein GALMADRAFT_937472 [Galerina marginata CBS 339.88]
MQLPIALAHPPAPGPDCAPALPSLSLLLTFQPSPRAGAAYCWCCLLSSCQPAPCLPRADAATGAPLRVRVRVRGYTEAVFRFLLFCPPLLPRRPPPSRCWCSWSCSSSCSYSCSCSRRTSQARPVRNCIVTTNLAHQPGPLRLDTPLKSSPSSTST